MLLCHVKVLTVLIRHALPACPLLWSSMLKTNSSPHPFSHTYSCSPWIHCFIFFHGLSFTPYSIMKRYLVQSSAFHKMSLNRNQVPSFFMISFLLWLSYLSTVARLYANGYSKNASKTLTPHNCLVFLFLQSSLQATLIKTIWERQGTADHYGQLS